VSSSIIGCEDRAETFTSCELLSIANCVGALRLRPPTVSTNSAQCFIWLTFSDIVGHYCSAAAPVFSRVTLF
jgi:hypothetical protein